MKINVLEYFEKGSLASHRQKRLDSPPVNGGVPDDLSRETIEKLKVRRTDINQAQWKPAGGSSVAITYWLYSTDKQQKVGQKMEP